MISFFKRASSPSDTVAAPRSPVLPGNEPVQTTTVEQESEEIVAILPQEGVTFLHALLNTDEPLTDLQLFSSKDRAFISNSIRKIRENSFEIPMLPNAVIRTQELLSNPMVEASAFIDVIKEDPTLSVELLRLANSSYLGFSYPTLDLQQAIIRIGFGQLHGLVTMLSLRSRILQGGYFKNEVKWVMELSLATAKLCQQLAQELEMPPGEAFTLGLLHHIEFLVILGEASQNSGKSLGGTVSRDAVLETSRRLGASLHERIASSWGFGDKQWVKLAINQEGVRNFEIGDMIELRKRLDTLQRMLTTALGGKHHLTDTAGFTARTLKNAIRMAVSPSSS